MVLGTAQSINDFKKRQKDKGITLIYGSATSRVVWEM